MRRRFSDRDSSTRASFAPQVEELNARIVPAVIASAAGGTPDNVLHIQGAATTINGLGQGTYATDGVQCGAGPLYQLLGGANLQGLGQFAVSGSLHGVGFIENGHAGGTLTFTDAIGSLTVQLTGPQQEAFSPLPDLFSQQITGGTGAFRHLTGTEMVQLDMWPIDDPDTGGLHGTFTLIEDAPHALPPLQGMGTGTFTHEPAVPDIAQVFELTGSADLAALGPVTIEGSVASTGFVAEGNAGGTLTFQNSHGSVTVQLTGPLQPGLAPLPQEFQYQVIASSGDYEGLAATGTLHLVLAPHGSAGTGAFSVST
jgi:hypothetical protein